jgi:hypothetical protein
LSALPFLFALWVNRRVESHLSLHGLMVGVVAALVYVIVAGGRPGPLLYKAAHGLKVLGGLPGGHCFGAPNEWGSCSCVSLKVACECPMVVADFPG